MLKRNRIGLLVWGTLVFTVGTVFIGSEVPFLAWMLMLGGATMLTFGIILLVKTTKYNNQLRAEYQNMILTTNCLHCGRQVDTNLESFVTHRNFPEGFIYCPICKKPISRNAFTAVPKQQQQIIN